MPTTTIDDEELKKKLTPEQYQIARQKGTEAPYTGEYVNETAKGMYVCRVCGQELFSSDTKFESTTPGLMGWPAFSDPVNLEHVELREDNSDGMHRTEVICKNCGSHLGHVFDEEGHGDSGKHYCVNSACLVLKKNE
jgi:peptide-methionine (R)-S-oxide reductase